MSGKPWSRTSTRHLRAHVEGQQQTIAAVLSRFFDPKDGQVTQRLAAFVDDQGVLARLLDKYLGPQNSVLTETLARQVGESSALFKKLSPTDGEGLIKVLEGQLRKVMNDGHSELVRALDPLAEGRCSRPIPAQPARGAQSGRREPRQETSHGLDGTRRKRRGAADQRLV
jgi:hypothetical protein